MSTIQSNLTSGLSHDMAAIFGQVYRVNDWDPMGVWDGFGDNMVAAGIPPPADWSTNVTSAAHGVGSGTTPGTHNVRYRYLNSKTQYVSNPTDPVTFSAQVGDSNTTGTYTLSNLVPSPDPKVDRIILELTDADGTQFYVASTLTNESQAVTLLYNDETLRTRPLDWDDFGHDVPPYFRYVEPHQGRLFGLGHTVYTDGAATIAGGSTVTGSGTQWTSAAKGRLILLSGDERRFVASVLSGTALLLEDSVAALSQRNYAIMSEAPDVLFWSKALFPESWDLANNQTRVLDGRPEKPRGLKSYRTDLIIYGERSMERLVYGENPFRDGKLEDIPGVRGAASRLCIQDIGDQIYALDYKGIHRYAGGAPEHVSEPIDPYFDVGDRAQGYVDFTYRDTFHSIHYPNRHQVVWFVVMSGLPGDATAYTQPQHAIVYDYLNGSVGLWRFDVAMVASTIGPGADGTTQTLLADVNGNLWAFGVGGTDGVHSASPVTVTVASSATSSQVGLSNSNALYADGAGLAGAMAYWVEGDELARIASNSASGFTLATGFAAPPAYGDTIYLGRIYARWKSKAFVGADPSHIWTQGRYCNLHFEPQSRGTVRFRWYINRAAAAYADYSLNFSDGGVTLDADNDYYVVDITESHGNARIPVPDADAAIHTLEFELEIVSATPFEMTGFYIDGYSEEEDGEK